jgi:Sulfotransferase family
MNGDQIHFIIIGAEKAGTTSLFEYLRRHPEVHLPADKEMAFFVDRNYHRGTDWYRRHVTRDAPPSATVGEASVAYMSGSPLADSSYPAAADAAATRPDLPSTASALSRPIERVIPSRIVEHLPAVKVICILRDPVARAYSQYQMEVLEGVESRSFDAALDDLLQPESLDAARLVPKRTNSYVTKGEYARVLSGFLDVLPRDRILALFTDELTAEAEATLRRVFDFLGVTCDYVPDNLGTRYREGADRRRVKKLNLYAFQAKLAKIGPAKKAWHALPGGARERIDRAYRVLGFRAAMWNAHRGAARDGISESAADRLRTHFLSDSEELGRLLSVDVPWLRGRRAHSDSETNSSALAG